MESEDQKFLALSARNRLRFLEREIRAAEEILCNDLYGGRRPPAPEPAQARSPAPPASTRTDRSARSVPDEARGTFANLLRVFSLLRAGEHSPARLERWEAALLRIERMFTDGTHKQAILAALNTLRYDVAERAELPMGEDRFLVRNRDHAAPVGQPFPCACVLDNIRSAFNCGAIMRSAEGFGVETVYLTGISAGPENTKVQKTAMGAAVALAIHRAASLCGLLQEKKAAGYAIYALETAEGARPLFTEQFRFPACVVFGNEEYGLDAGILSAADHVIEIPMFGRKNSFNVAAGASIFFYEARRQWEARTK